MSDSGRKRNLIFRLFNKQDIEINQQNSEFSPENSEFKSRKISPSSLAQTYSCENSESLSDPTDFAEIPPPQDELQLLCRICSRLVSHTKLNEHSEWCFKKTKYQESTISIDDKLEKLVETIKTNCDTLERRLRLLERQCINERIIPRLEKISSLPPSPIVSQSNTPVSLDTDDRRPFHSPFSDQYGSSSQKKLYKIEVEGQVLEAICVLAFAAINIGTACDAFSLYSLGGIHRDLSKLASSLEVYMPGQRQTPKRCTRCPVAVFQDGRGLPIYHLFVRQSTVDLADRVGELIEVKAKNAARQRLAMLELEDLHNEEPDVTKNRMKRVNSFSTVSSKFYRDSNSELSYTAAYALNRETASLSTEQSDSIIGLRPYEGENSLFIESNELYDLDEEGSFPSEDFVESISDAEKPSNRIENSLFEEPDYSRAELPCLSDFNFVKYLSKGAYGTVVAVSRKNTNDIYAMKIIKKSDSIKKNRVAQVRIERDILASSTEHDLSRFVVDFLWSFFNETSLFMIMEYCPGGDLNNLLDLVGSLNEDIARLYVAEICFAVEKIHTVLNVIHRDIKPANVLISEDGHLKLTDFGLSSERSYEDSDGKIVGTPAYTAPEVYSKGYHCAESDWFSIGALAFELLTGLKPFDGEDTKAISQAVCKGYIDYPDFLSKDAVSFIKALLRKDPRKRMSSLESVMNHPWMRDVDFEDLFEALGPIVPPHACSDDTQLPLEEWLSTEGFIKDPHDVISPLHQKSTFTYFSYINVEMLKHLNEAIVNDLFVSKLSK